MIIRKIRRQDSAQTGFIANDYLIQAFPPNCTNDPLDVRTLPRSSWRSQYFLNAKLFHLPSEISKIGRAHV